MTHEPTFDQDAFFVEGSVPSANTQETPESIDTGDYVFSNNSNFLPSDSRFGSNRQYNLRRNDHLALARENSLYNLLQPSEKAKEEQVKVITYFPLDHIPDPNLTIDTTETDHDESIADSQATSAQSRNQSLNDFTFDSSENLGDLFGDVNSPVYTPPILDTTGETLYRTNSINDIYNNTTSSDDVQQPISDENNEHSLIGGNISQIENNESNSAISQHDNPSTSSPLPQRVSNRELADLGPTLQNRRRIVPLTLHRREINGNLHQTFGFEDDSQ